MSKTKIFWFILVAVLGAFLFVYGEFDDSPGGQLIGLLAVIVGILGIIKNVRKSKKKISDPDVNV